MADWQKRREVHTLIPQRDPFLYLDEIVESGPETLRARYTVRPTESWTRGHYPGNPIMPGVLLCESLFQGGAALIAKELLRGSAPTGVPVITRIKEAKFKRMVRPGETLDIEVQLSERVGPAFWLTGKARVGTDTAVRVEFACTVAPPPGRDATREHASAEAGLTAADIPMP